MSLTSADLNELNVWECENTNSEEGEANKCERERKGEIKVREGVKTSVC